MTSVHCGGWGRLVHLEGEKLLPQAMSRANPGPLRRFFRGLLSVLDGTRRLVVNVVFLVVVAIVLIAIFGNRGLTLEEKTALVVAPQGVLVEQYSGSAWERARDQMLDQQVPETRVRDIVRALRLAKDDKRIEYVVLQPDWLWYAGLGAMQDLADAIEDFQASGKKVIAHSTGMAQHQYYLASLADEVLLDPRGLVFLEGYGRYRNYFKTALDKLGVDVHLFRVGEYKSAAEPYVRDDMSPESEESNLYWLDGLWSTWKEDVAGRRDIDPDTISTLIDEFPQRLVDNGGDLAKVVLESGLVDRLATHQEASGYFSTLGAPGDYEGEEFRQIAVGDYLRARFEKPTFDRDAVAVVVAQGAIVSGDAPPGTVGGDTTAGLLRAARENESIKAVVLRVDSPGGEVLPSELIRREVELLRSNGKPVVASMGDVAASGGYWISMSADRIWAQPGTITGSIGIFGLILTIPDTLSKIGVFTDGVGTTPLAGAFRIDRPLGESVSEIFQAVIDNGYEQFVEGVAHSRGMTVARADSVARGRVWSGVQAKDRGLVDELGGLRQAAANAAELAGLDDYELRYLEEAPTAIERLLLDASANLRGLLRGGGPDLLGGLRHGVARSTLFNDVSLLFNASPQRLGVYAYCFCRAW